MPPIPKQGDLFELIELETGRDDPNAQAEEWTSTLAECIKARGHLDLGVSYSYQWLNARVLEVVVHDVKGARKQ